MRRSQSPTALDHLARCQEIVGHHVRACELRARAAMLRSMGAEQRSLPLAPTGVSGGAVIPGVLP